MTTTEPTSDNQQDRKNQIMVGDLPEDFLRVPSVQQQQQVMADAGIAQALSVPSQMRFAPLPANVMGKITISIVQAKLAKNYSLMKMDPYVRIRLGHSVFETPTAYSGAKNPRWNKEVSAFLPHGVDCIYVEIFDEKQFTIDDRIAWAYITIPQAVLNGDTGDEWFPLSGKQGDEKEGMINLVLTFTPADQLQQQVAYGAPIMYQQPAQTIVYSPQQHVLMQQQQLLQQQRQQQQQQQQQQQHPPQPMYTEDDLKQVHDMFPNMDLEAIKSIMEANRGNKDATINACLSMSAD